jgi:hypothetical protein
LHRWLHHFFAYLLFALFALLGVVLMFNLHTMFVSLSMLFGARPQVTRFLYVWGSFFLLGIYIVGIVFIEHAMNQAAKEGRVLNQGVRVFAIEGGLALLSVVIPWVAEMIAGV